MFEARMKLRMAQKGISVESSVKPAIRVLNQQQT
jgi:hypothetical protein